MRVLTVADLHQRRHLYEQLTAAVRLHKPDVLAVLGDFLDGFTPQAHTPEMLTVTECAMVLAALPCKIVFCRGNHEDSNFEDFELVWRAAGRPAHFLHGSAVFVGPLAIVGFPCWMGDDEWYAQGRALDSYEPDVWLTRLLRAAGPAGGALWIAHEPPCLELSEGWLSAPEWADAIRRHQPLVFACGHDHNTPLRAERWLEEIGRTKCINVGQRVYPHPGKLLYCTLEFEFAADGTPKLSAPPQRHGA